MKRYAIYLSGAAAVIAVLLLTVVVDGLPRRFVGNWQPDEGMTQGYIVQLTADSLVTATAPGSALQVITPGAFEAATPVCDVDGPHLTTGSPLLDAAWTYAWARLSGRTPSAYSLYMTAPLVSTNVSRRDIEALMPARGARWPLADHDIPAWVIMASDIAILADDRSLSAHLIREADRLMAYDSLRVAAPGSALRRGGGDGDLSGALPGWMDDADRFATASLGYNALSAAAYSSLATLSLAAGDSVSAAAYARLSRRISQAIQRELWMPEKGYFSQYIYGRTDAVASPAASGPGNAIAAASEAVTDEVMAARVVGLLPRTPYGIARTFPMPPAGSGETAEASAAAQGLWAIACGRAANSRSLWNALAVAVRNTGLSITSAGDDPAGHDAAAAYIGTIARVIFGLHPMADGLEISPVVPDELRGTKRLTGVRHLDAVLDITVEGTGTRVASMMIDGNAMADRIIPRSLTGRHEIKIEMVSPATAGADTKEPPVVLPALMPAEPQPQWTDRFSAVIATDGEESAGYGLIVNGERYEDVTDGAISAGPRRGFAEMTVFPLDAEGRVSGHSAEPHQATPLGANLHFQAEWYAARELARDIYRRMLRNWTRRHKRGLASEAERPNRRLTQIVSLPSDGSLTFTVESPAGAECVMALGYADGRDAGRRATLLRSVSLNGRRIATLAMPRYALPADSTITLETHPLRVTLAPGINEITISARDADVSPGATDTVMIDYLRIATL